MASFRSLRRTVPTWWGDAKLGVFVHWTPASVVGFAPTDTDIGEVLAAGGSHPLSEVPYTEWYGNSLRFPDSSAARHHAEHHPGVSYADLGPRFEAGLQHWDPDGWAQAFAGAGARYVVLVTKHHDGYCLWPSSVPHPRRSGWHTRRDVVGELAEAVRGAGMRFGVYYSGGLDWTFDDRPLGTIADVVAACPTGDYPAYAEAQVRELIARYRPSVLWNDIAWPAGRGPLQQLFADYYRAVPDGVVNDRFMPASVLNAVARSRSGARLIDRGIAWGQRRSPGGLVPPQPPHYDVQTPEYTVFDGIRRRPFEVVRGMDRSFGYNRMSTEADFISRDELLATLADVASKGGNLLLNVGPRGEDATIPEAQLTRLRWLAEWRGLAEGLSCSRPWVLPAARSVEGDELRFAARGDAVTAVVAGRPGATITVPQVRATPTTSVRVDGRPSRWEATPAGITLEMPMGADWPVVTFYAAEAEGLS